MNRILPASASPKSYSPAGKTLKDYPLLPSVRGRNALASAEFKPTPISRETKRERKLLDARAAPCADGTRQ